VVEQLIRNQQVIGSNPIAGLLSGAQYAPARQLGISPLARAFTRIRSIAPE
jgi:hypothetical protein